MPSTRSHSALLGLVLAAALVAGACSSEEPDSAAAPTPSPSTTRPAPPEVSIPPRPDVILGLRRALADRAAAVRDGDLGAFEAGLARRDATFLAEQTTYFDNLTQLPLGRFDYALDRRTLVRSGDEYWVEVEVALQLASYDTAPVITRDRFRFRPAGPQAQRYKLVSTTDPAWEEEYDVEPAPWDAGPVVVREGVGVLGIFDAVSVTTSASLLHSVEAGISQVAAVVPYEWSRSVVVYALSDDSFMATVDGLGGKDPEDADGVAFPVYASESVDAPVASTRFVLHPRMLGRTGERRDRLIRHELTHIAVGPADDNAPLWLSEGIAELVSVQPLAPEDRALPGAAVEAAEAVPQGLPTDEDFEVADAEAAYGLSWWDCEYIAATYGTPVLWALLEELNDQVGSDKARIYATLGINSRQLARKGAKLLLATYAPESPEDDPEEEPEEEPETSESPEPSESPSSEETSSR